MGDTRGLEKWEGQEGSEERISYSITGDTVNTAKRIESLAKAGRNTILADDQVYERARSLATVKPWAPMQVKGKGGQLKVYEVLSLA